MPFIRLQTAAATLLWTPPWSMFAACCKAECLKLLQNLFCPCAGFAGALLQSPWVQQLMGPALSSVLGIDAGGIAAILSGTSGLTPEQMVTRLLSMTAKVCCVHQWLLHLL